MIPDPIPHTEKVSWLDEHLMTGEERDVHMHAFGVLDRAWRNAWNQANSWTEIEA